MKEKAQLPGLAATGLYIVLAPNLTIIDASEAYLGATFLSQKEIQGRHMFDVFPDNPADPSADGVQNLRASLNRVLHGEPAHQMGLQKYDVRDHVAQDGSWVTKFWLPSNTAVYANGSAEVPHLIHQVEDVTRMILLQRRMEERSIVLAEQRSTVEQMLKDLRHQQQTLNAAHSSLIALMKKGTGPDRELVRELEIRTGAPETRRYFVPGETAPESGLCRTFHRIGCEFALRTIQISQGSKFARCADCRAAVLYRMFRPVAESMVWRNGAYS